jgi:uncharacterized coiled-coil DUF342 family protein
MSIDENLELRLQIKVLSLELRACHTRIRELMDERDRLTNRAQIAETAFVNVQSELKKKRKK